MRHPHHKNHKKKHHIASKMKKRYEHVLDDFIKHGKDQSDEAMWKYARVNRLTDQLGVTPKRYF